MSKNVLITGVSRGIGRSIAEAFLRDGYTLIGTYYQNHGYPATCDNANDLIKQYGNDRVVLLGSYDFTKIDQIYALLKSLQKHRFDVVVLNAGIFIAGHDFEDFDLDRFNLTMNCNFYSQLILSTGLKDNINTNGSIILISSIDALSGTYGSIAYSISKAAVASLCKCLCCNYGKRGIRVNAVSPGAIDTAMNTIENINLAPMFTPFKRVGIPSDIAEVVLFLASQKSSFINGANLIVDGGYKVEDILLKCEGDPLLSTYLQFYANHYDEISYNNVSNKIELNGVPLFNQKD